MFHKGTNCPILKKIFNKNKILKQKNQDESKKVENKVPNKNQSQKIKFKVKNRIQGHKAQFQKTEIKYHFGHDDKVIVYSEFCETFSNSYPLEHLGTANSGLVL